MEFKVILCYRGSLVSVKNTEEPSPTNRQQNSNKKLWHFFDQRMVLVQVFMASLEEET